MTAIENKINLLEKFAEEFKPKKKFYKGVGISYKEAEVLYELLIEAINTIKTTSSSYEKLNEAIDKIRNEVDKNV